MRLDVEALMREDKSQQYAVQVKNRFEMLQSMDEEKMPEDLWQDMKNVLLDSAKEVVDIRKTVKQKEWMTPQTIRLIEEKRMAKGSDEKAYKELKKQVQKQVRIDKQMQTEQVCKTLEEQNEKGNMREVFRLVKNMTRKFQPRYGGIKSADGKNLTTTDEISQRWKEYCEDMYSDHEVNETVTLTETEPPPTRAEIERAISRTANGKATGPDNVPAELFKEGGDATVNAMHRLCEAIWTTGEWPEEWTQSVFIPIPKKGDLSQCSNYRTISLVSHASKILLRVILERIQRKTENELSDEQAGFRPGRGTRDQITNLRIMMSKAREFGQLLYMCFIDFKKAFDSVPHEKLWIVMLEMGYPAHIVDLLAKLYKKQKAAVKIANTISEWFRIRRGVRQGCVISPYLFNILLILC